jgi:hypothetical protein
MAYESSLLMRSIEAVVAVKARTSGRGRGQMRVIRGPSRKLGVRGSHRRGREHLALRWLHRPPRGKTMGSACGTGRVQKLTAGEQPGSSRGAVGGRP